MERLIALWDRYRIQLIVVITILIAAGSWMMNQNKRQQLSTSATTAVLASSSAATKTSSASTAKTVAIDIKGAVKRPGVYQLKAASRVNEALIAAGGPLANADLRQVNLAKQLMDQQLIYIPVVGESQPVAMPADASSTNSSADNSAMVNLNTATKEQLCQITGIGDKKADLILQYRQEHGQFKSVEELQEITGFGEKTVAKLKEHLAV